MSKLTEEKQSQPFTSSTHETPTLKPFITCALVTRYGLNAASRKTSGIIDWIYFVFHSATMLLFGLSIGAMCGAFAGSWLLKSGRVPVTYLIIVSRWSWAVGGVLGFAFTFWLVSRWFQSHRNAARKNRAQNDSNQSDFDTTL